MEFDRLTAVLLIRRDEAPKLSPAEEDALQDAHLDCLARLHEAGAVVAAGPTPGDDNRRLRGLMLLTVSPEDARRLAEQDPAIRAGRFTLEVLPWLVPKGAMTFHPVRFPHSAAEAEGPGP